MVISWNSLSDALARSAGHNRIATSVHKSYRRIDCHLPRGLICGLLPQLPPTTFSEPLTWPNDNSIQTLIQVSTMLVVLRHFALVVLGLFLALLIEVTIRIATNLIVSLEKTLVTAHALVKKALWLLLLIADELASLVLLRSVECVVVLAVPAVAACCRDHWCLMEWAWAVDGSRSLLAACHHQLVLWHSLVIEIHFGAVLSSD